MPLLVLLILFSASFSSAEQDYSDQDCLPNIADHCFEEVRKNLQCHLSTKRHPLANECTKRGVDDFCSSIMDALSCAKDIVDVGCSVDEGQQRFDRWLTGLDAAANSLCLGDRKNAHELLDHPDCWSTQKFIACTQNSAGVDHINDMLTYDLDYHECDRLLSAFAICNMNAVSPESGCSAPSAVITDLISSFFKATSCTSHATSDANVGQAISVTLTLLYLAVQVVIY